MAIQVTHEAEVSRQHARYPIPAMIRLNGREFKLREWSVSGFSADHIPAEIIGGEKFLSCHLVFDLESFDLSVELEFEVMRFETDSGFLSARYMNIPKRNLSLLHYVINAYLAGEVVSAGDILSVASRDDFVEKNPAEELDEELSGIHRFTRKGSRWVGLFSMLGLFVLLLWFIAYTLYYRTFVIEAVSARVQGPVVVLSAPFSGQFEASAAFEGQRRTTTGELLGIVKLANGGTASIESPCDCDLLEMLALNGAFVAGGQQLFSLLPENAELQVEARVEYSDVTELRTGQEASVQLTDGNILDGVVKQIKAVSRLEDLQASASDTVNRTALVTIVTDQPIPGNMLGSVVTVRINTLWQREASEL